MSAILALRSRLTGLLVMTVEPNSPAEQGGLLLGDILVTIEDTPVRHPDDLLTCLSADRIHTAVRVRLVRGGEHQERSIVIGERP